MAKVSDKDVKTSTDFSNNTRLENIINESFEYEDEVEDFNQILRENGIEIN